MSSRLPRIALAAAIGALALVPAATATAAERTLTGLRDARYCEILELKGAPPSANVTVWNTIGLNKCPAAQWNAFDAGSLASELGDTLVILNGPRHFLMDSVSTPALGPTRSFHDLEMRKVATIPIRTSADLAQATYTDRTIARSNTWRWKKGHTVFELVAPGGDTYVMQSYAQIKDPSLTLGKLAALGRRLEPPAGWHYRTRRLRSDLVLTADGSATVIQDELQNTYQLATTTRRGKRAKHALRLTGKTRTVTPATPGTVEDHGTVTGTPFGKGTIVLVGTFTGGRLEGTFRLTFPHGSVLGTVSMPYTISGNEIDFKGKSRMTSGTGAYRGITSGSLATTDHNTLDGQNGTLSVGGSVTY
ncbi:MAG: hypothetical protein QOJ07_1527 [Thermoleophilaceae bacterium]|nr:hypothetical protein [Thermoleophilaceae bacterium]